MNQSSVMIIRMEYVAGHHANSFITQRRRRSSFEFTVLFPPHRLLIPKTVMLLFLSARFDFIYLYISSHRIANSLMIFLLQDYLNHHCHRGASCKFRHGKPNSTPSVNPVFYLTTEAQSYNHHSHPQHLQYPDNGGVGGGVGSIVPSPSPRTSESATVTTPETTAMVAAAAAAGYLALQQKHGQQQHHHQQCGPGAQASSAVPTSALPSASAAAVAAAAAATAIATQQQHAPLNQRVSDFASRDFSAPLYFRLSPGLRQQLASICQKIRCLLVLPFFLLYLLIRV